MRPSRTGCVFPSTWTHPSTASSLTVSPGRPNVLVPRLQISRSCTMPKLPRSISISKPSVSSPWPTSTHLLTYHTRKTTTLGSWLRRILGLLSTPNLHPELPVFANDTIPVSPITTSNTVTVICPAPAPSALAIISPQGLPTITLSCSSKNTPLVPIDESVQDDFYIVEEYDDLLGPHVDPPSPPSRRLVSN
jgi:hypothetical protein